MTSIVRNPSGCCEDCRDSCSALMECVGESGGVINKDALITISGVTGAPDDTCCDDADESCDVFNTTIIMDGPLSAGGPGCCIEAPGIGGFGWEAIAPIEDCSSPDLYAAVKFRICQFGATVWLAEAPGLFGPIAMSVAEDTSAIPGFCNGLCDAGSGAGITLHSNGANWIFFPTCLCDGSGAVVTIQLI